MSIDELRQKVMGERSLYDTELNTLLEMERREGVRVGREQMRHELMFWIKNSSYTDKLKAGHEPSLVPSEQKPAPPKGSE